MNEPVDLREAHRTLLSLSPVRTGLSTCSSSSDPQSSSGEIDIMFERHFANLQINLHPAIAAVIAHLDMTINQYHRREKYEYLIEVA